MQMTVQPKYVLQDYECPICGTFIETRKKVNGGLDIVRIAPDHCTSCLAKFDWKNVWWANEKEHIENVYDV